MKPKCIFPSLNIFLPCIFILYLYYHCFSHLLNHSDLTNFEPKMKALYVARVLSFTSFGLALIFKKVNFFFPSLLKWRNKERTHWRVLQWAPGRKTKRKKPSYVKADDIASICLQYSVWNGLLAFPKLSIWHRWRTLVLLLSKVHSWVVIFFITYNYWFRYSPLISDSFHF